MPVAFSCWKLTDSFLDAFRQPSYLCAFGERIMTSVSPAYT